MKLDIVNWVKLLVSATEKHKGKITQQELSGFYKFVPFTFLSKRNVW